MLPIPLHCVLMFFAQIIGIFIGGILPLIILSLLISFLLPKTTIHPVVGILYVIIGMVFATIGYLFVNKIFTTWLSARCQVKECNGETFPKNTKPISYLCTQCGDIYNTNFQGGTE